ncbi:50S ribosomal protein L11 methyltransferase [Aegicerativicinus sediminis]|uniref:50S ribosomal protein L11 methyltransferase n=1 Tax=Aegicerativicinus sediminis TaxID=2893202 RepID=UPI001E60C5C3|nr:50S ribosomal protein L11 methyltransferase [Aegicerativicinus sediminis]
MDQNSYLEFDFSLSPKEPWSDVLAAELGELGFESFSETDTGIKAYISKDLSKDLVFDDLMTFTSPCEVNYSVQEIQKENWNMEWEKNFHPILVDDRCSIRAPFHEKPDAPIDIIIEPKMSFGTGHHETTYLMVEHLLEMDLSNLRVLDMGCGTGVLAILASIKGALMVDAIDIDNWCYLNSIENVERNNCANINVFEGDAQLLEGKTYDLIIANINRNILLNDIQFYSKSLSFKGTLLLSGFYKEDIEAIVEECAKYGLKYENQRVKNNWVALKFLN